MAVWDDTLKVLRERAAVSESCLVAFSGGKDSLAVMDLCCRTFKRVLAFHMFFVPGLECVEQELAAAKSRWGVEVVQYPHWVLFKALKNGVYGNESAANEGLPDLTLHDIYTWAMAETGIHQIATGAKRSDGLWRKRFFYVTRHWEGMFYPIEGWMKRDVLAYLSARKIPVPVQDSAQGSGIDLSSPAINWLAEKHPEDLKRVEAWFPYVRAAVYRKRFYGI